MLTTVTDVGCRAVTIQGAYTYGLLTQDKKDLTPVSNFFPFAVCAFRDLILPPFSAFFTEKKLRTLK